jgi:hypothetical protein
MELPKKNEALKCNLMGSYKLNHTCQKVRRYNKGMDLLVFYLKEGRVLAKDLWIS